MSLLLVAALAGAALVDGQPPPELQPYHAGVELENGLAPWYQPQAVTSQTEWIPQRTDYGPAVEQWRPLVAGQFEPEDVSTAMCLIYYESRGDPNAKNPHSSASGLFQLLKTWHDYFGIDPFVPEQNVYAAARLKDLYGWTQWNPYKRGLCR